MSEQNIDLSQIFGLVTEKLSNNKESLNQADSYNHDHGDHMVQIFQTITEALNEKKSAPQNEALSHAANKLEQKSAGSSGKLYAQGLQQASQQVQGDQINPQMAMQVLESILSAGKSGAQGQNEQASNGGFLGSLIGGFSAGNKQSGGLSDGLDLGDLITAGQAFFQSRQRGETNLDAIVDAVTAVSGMGSQPYRQQSTQLVAKTFIESLKNIN